MSFQSFLDRRSKKPVLNAQLSEHFEKLWELEHKRLELEKQHVGNFGSSVDVFGSSVKIENILQQQKKILYELLNTDFGEKQEAYRKLFEWRAFDLKNRYLPLLPIGAQHEMADVDYFKYPDSKKDLYYRIFVESTMSASYSIPEPMFAFLGYSPDCILPGKKHKDQLVKKSEHDIMPIIGLVDSQTDAKKTFPFLWSIDPHDSTSFNEIQVHNFIIPELRKLRHRTQSIYLKQLINYHCVLFRKVEVPMHLYIPD